MLLSMAACGNPAANTTTAAAAGTTAAAAAGTTAAAAKETTAAAAAGGAGKELVLGTGGTTGTYYAVGGTMATVLNPLMKESNLTVTSTGASKAIIQLVDDGDAQLAIVQNDVMYYAYTGTDLFADHACSRRGRNALDVPLAQ